MVKGKIKKIAHVGIAVENVDKAISLLQDCFGAELGFKAPIDIQQQISALLSMGDATVELMEPTSEDATVAKFIKQKGAGLHHISLEVENINELVKHLESKGIRVVGKFLDGPGLKIAFIHPKSMFGTLIELVEVEGEAKS